LIIAHLARACYPFHPFGGLEQHVYQFTKTFAQMGHTVHLFTQPPDSGLPPTEFFWPPGVIHHFVNYQTFSFLRRNSIPDRLVNYPLFSWRLAREMRKVSPAPQVVYSQGLAAFGYAANLWPGVPLVLNPQGMEEFKNKSRLKQLVYLPFQVMVRFTAKKSSSVIATDTNLVPEVEHILKVPPERVRLIPNAVDLDEIDRKLANSRVPDETRPTLTLLSVGRLEENKGLEVGLRALKYLEIHAPGTLPPDWRWVVAGEGGERTRLEAQATKLGLSSHVIFPGRLSDEELYGYYCAADLFFHPTLYEGSSLVTLEAMGARLPVVGSAVGGLPDKIMENGPFENGRLAPPGEAEALAHKLKEILDMPLSVRHRLGQNSRNLVEQKFSLRVSVEALADLFEELVNPSKLFQPSF
jgi:glycosyltransferase involved in cell wall biosynthesis